MDLEISSSRTSAALLKVFQLTLEHLGLEHQICDKGNFEKLQLILVEVKMPLNQKLSIDAQVLKIPCVLFNTFDVEFHS